MHPYLMIGLRLAVAIASMCGLVAARAMLAKSRAAAAGLLTEPSVVELPEARLLVNVPNAAFGLAYYALAIVAAASDMDVLLITAAVVSVPALATSIYLATKLVRQRLECSRCWTAHAVNALLCPLLIVSAALAR